MSITIRSRFTTPAISWAVVAASLVCSCASSSGTDSGTDAGTDAGADAGCGSADLCAANQAAGQGFVATLQRECSGFSKTIFDGADRPITVGWEGPAGGCKLIARRFENGVWKQLGCPLAGEASQTIFALGRAADGFYVLTSERTNETFAGLALTRWNGNGWVTYPSLGLKLGGLQELYVVEGASGPLVGYSTYSQNEPFEVTSGGFVEAFDGGSWQELGGTLVRNGDAGLYEMMALILDPAGNPVALGPVENTPTPQMGFVWDGARWNSLPQPLPGAGPGTARYDHQGRLTMLAVIDGGVLLAAYDDGGWTPVSPALPVNLSAGDLHFTSVDQPIIGGGPQVLMLADAGWITLLDEAPAIAGPPWVSLDVDSADHVLSSWTSSSSSNLFENVWQADQVTCP